MSGLIAVSYVLHEEGYGLLDHQMEMFKDRLSAIAWLVELLWEEENIQITQFNFNTAVEVTDMISWVKRNKITLKYLVQLCNSKNIGDFTQDVNLYVKVKDESGLADEKDYDSEDEVEEEEEDKEEENEEDKSDDVDEQIFKLDDELESLMHTLYYSGRNLSDETKKRIKDRITIIENNRNYLNNERFERKNK